MDPFGIGRVHNGLTSGTDGDWFRHLTLSTLCDPSNFRRKAFDVTFFFIQCSLCHKHREIAILNANFFYTHVNKALDLLPDVVREGSKDIATRDVIILNHLRFCNDLRIPFREVIILVIFDSFYVYVVQLFLFFLLFTPSLFLRLFLLCCTSFFLRLSFLFLLTSRRSCSSKVHNGRFMLRQFNNFLHVFSADCYSGCVDHRVEANIIEVIPQALVNNESDLLINVIDN